MHLNYQHWPAWMEQSNLLFLFILGSFEEGVLSEVGMLYGCQLSEKCKNLSV